MIKLLQFRIEQELLSEEKMHCVAVTVETEEKTTFSFDLSASNGSNWFRTICRIVCGIENEFATKVQISINERNVYKIIEFHSHMCDCVRDKSSRNIIEKSSIAHAHAEFAVHVKFCSKSWRIVQSQHW